MSSYPGFAPDHAYECFLQYNSKKVIVAMSLQLWMCYEVINIVIITRENKKKRE